MNMESITNALAILGILGAFVGVFVVRNIKSYTVSRKIVRRSIAHTANHMDFLKRESSWIILLSCWVTGYDPRLVADLPPYSQRKIQLYAIAVSSLSVTWFLVGYLVASNMFGLSQLSSLLTGALACAIAFFIEKAIILTTHLGLQIKILRVFLACCMAILGSVMLSGVIFQQEIDLRMVKVRIQNADKLKTLQQQKIANDSLKYVLDRKMASIQVYIDKSTSGQGTTNAGHGSTSKYYRRQIDSFQLRKAAIDRVTSIYLDSIHDEKKELALKNQSPYQRLNVLFDLVSKEKPGTLIFVMFFLVFFAIEILGLILKTDFNLPPTEDPNSSAALHEVSD